MTSPYLPHPLDNLPEPGFLEAIPAGRRPHDTREHTRATEPPGGETTGQLPGDPHPDRLASGDHPAPQRYPAEARPTRAHTADSRPTRTHAAETTPTRTHPAEPHPAHTRAVEDRPTSCPGAEGRPARLSATFGLPAVPASVGAARRHIGGLLRAWDIAQETLDDAIVVTSELVTNAVTHSASEQVVCRLQRTARRLRIEVEDQNRAVACPTPRVSAPDDQSGRGLLLVATLSADWGVIAPSDLPGRIVWAELQAVPDEPHTIAPDPIETTPGPSPTRPKDVHHAPTPLH
ncbi:ATP-binding protein [Streptomyces sp. NPDC088789]|uniref:ATP-binding protein n=1 Tax=Streptomyces sp. NPDC088789 TaxID=3365899 RepID=UPI0038248CEB